MKYTSSVEIEYNGEVVEKYEKLGGAGGAYNSERGLYLGLISEDHKTRINISLEDSTLDGVKMLLSAILKRDKDSS